MKKQIIISVLSISIRGVTLLGRFLIILGISKYLSIQDLGIYSLFFSTVILATMVVGFDFYTFRTREMFSPTCENILETIRDQFIFHFIFYCVFLPCLVFIFLKNVVSFEFIIPFYIILIFEHLSQEFFRLFTSLSKPIIANIILFIRSASWVYIIAVLLFLNQITLSLDLIFKSWMAGSIISVIASVIILKEMRLGKLFTPIRWGWIKKGIQVSIPFFISTMAYKVIEFSNRYFIDYYLTKEEVGIFSFFNSISNLLHVFVFTGIIMLIYPKMVETFETDKDKYYHYEKQLKLYTPLGSALLIIIFYFLSPILLNIAGKEQFIDNINILWILMGSIFVFNLSLIPHYCLYVRKFDKAIMVITLIGMVANIILNLILIQKVGIFGAAISLLITYTIVSLLKYWKNFRPSSFPI